MKTATDNAKTCRVCGELKPIESFNRHPQTSDGYDSRCRLCGKADAKARREARKARLSAQKQTCRTCGEEKPLTDYYPSKQHSNGVDSRCKDCSKSGASSSIRSGGAKIARAPGEHPRARFEDEAACADCDTPLTRNRRVLLDGQTLCYACRRARFEGDSHVS
jgi:hypothetical protein